MKHNISEIKRMLLTMAVFFLTATVAWAQSTVTGIVKDEFGEGIIGANVIVKGTTQGGTTDMDGLKRRIQGHKFALLPEYAYLCTLITKVHNAKT